jgi:selenocysteine lyase/cysteine desulfurase
MSGYNLPPPRNESNANVNYQSLAKGYRAVFIAENLLREFVRQLLKEANLDISRECQSVLKGSTKRFSPSGTLSRQDDLEACTFGELIQILFGAPGSHHGPRFSNKFQDLNPRSFRSMLELARETRNAVTHFWPLSQDTLANVREVSRNLLVFLKNMDVSSSRVDDLAHMYDELSHKDERPRSKDFQRRYLRWAAIGLPEQEVIRDVADHLSNPDPETAAIMEVPYVLATVLDLRSTILFTQNTTQAFRSALEVIRFHEAIHQSRRGEEGLSVSRVLLKGSRTRDFGIGQLLRTDVEHPSLVHMANAVWPEDEISTVTVSDLLFTTQTTYSASTISAEVTERFLLAMRRPVSAVVIPHVVWVNGAKLDVVKICEAIRGKHPTVTTIVDGAQAVGHIPLQVEHCDKENENIDFYLGCGHKWLGGPETVGFVRVGRRFNGDCIQCRKYLSGNDQLTDASGFALNYEGEQIGTHQRGLAKGLLRALRLLPDHSGLDNLYSRIRNNSDALRKVVKSFGQLTILDPPNELSSGIVAFTLRQQDGDLFSGLLRALQVESFTVAAYPLPHYLQRQWGHGDFIRMSPGPNLAAEDISVFEAVLHKTLL